jgi:hypothetical protein
MYDIISIPKTGGTIFKQYLYDSEYYSQYFYYADLINKEKKPRSWPHSVRSCDVENPVLIIREPLDRFISCYNYYNNGSEVWGGDKKQVSVEEFLSDSCPQKPHFWFAHFRTQSWYMSEKDYKKTIVLVYNKDIGRLINKLLYELKIPANKTAEPVEKFNVTKKTKVGGFSNTQLRLVHEKYKEDFVLYEKLLNRPDMFKKVIDI